MVRHPYEYPAVRNPGPAGEAGIIKNAAGCRNRAGMRLGSFGFRNE